MNDNIVFISDSASGGAAVSCSRLLKALKLHMPDRLQWVIASGACEQNAIVASDWPDWINTTVYRLGSRFVKDEGVLRALGNRVGDSSVFRAVERIKPGLIHLHGLHEGLSFDMVSRLFRQHPVVWTMHDMWPLTGYCYYSYACEKYCAGCQGECPELGRCGATWRTPSAEWQKRDDCFRRYASRITMVAPSRWMANCARNRFADRIAIEHIPYGVDLQIFKPIGDRSSVRRVLGLPVDARIVLAGAVGVNDLRKGLVDVADLLGEVQNRLNVPLLLVILGEGSGSGVARVPSASVGKIKDESLMNLYYNAADLFLLPSRADNLPNMLIESVAAGTPVVAYDIGGCGDVVINGETGYLAKPADTTSLMDCICRIILSPHHDNDMWTSKCRIYAEKNYNAELQAARYMALYTRLLRVAC